MVGSGLKGAVSRGWCVEGDLHIVVRAVVRASATDGGYDVFPPSSHIVVKTRRGPRSEASEEAEADDGSQPKPENVTPLPSPAKKWTGEEWRASNPDGNSRAWNENSGKKNYWDWYNKPNLADV